MDEGLLANDMLLLAINGFITRYVYVIGYSMVRTKCTFKLKFADLVLAVTEPPLCQMDSLMIYVITKNTQ